MVKSADNKQGAIISKCVLVHVVVMLWPSRVVLLDNLIKFSSAINSFKFLINKQRSTRRLLVSCERVNNYSAQLV